MTELTDTREALVKRVGCSGAHWMTNEKAEEVQEALWSGFLPLRVQVEDDGMEGGAALPPLYLQAPRQAPVGAVREQVLHHLGEGFPAGSVAFTFWDTHQVHLNSNYPVGVVYDLLESGQIPWKLAVKCTRDHQGDEAKDQFFNALKAASYAATGSAQHVITMPTAEANKLWDACKAGDRQKYKDAAKSFHGKMENAERFLVRVFCKRNQNRLDSAGSWWSKHIESKLKVVAVEKEGSMRIMQALKDWLQVDMDLETARITVAGIPCPLELSLGQLWTLLRAPDYTLYIVVRWP